MQTRNPGLRALTLALAGVLTLGLAACEETKTVTPLTPTEITISPSGTVDLEVGDRISVVANVTNMPATGGTVTYASSNTAVATVDGTGTVMAVAPGIATITASAPSNQAGGTVRAALAVRVSAAPGEGPDTTSARVFITGITTPAGLPTRTDSISGTVVVRLEVEPGSSDSLVVSIGNRRACAISFAAAASLLTADGQQVSGAQVPLTCTVNTATLGVNNGQTTVTARLFDGGATVASNQQTITLTNVSTVNAAISAARQATNPNTGLIWNDGAVTVRATPAIFGGAQISRVSVSLRTANGALADTTISDTTSANGVFEVTFPETSTALRNVLAPDLRAVITAVTAAGDQFQFPLSNGTMSTQILTDSLRYDNLAPQFRAGAALGLASNGFVGDISASSYFAATSAQDTSEVAGVEREGVNAVTVQFFAVQTTTNLVADSVIAQGEQFSTGSDLESGETYQIAARVCDSLNNCRTVGVANDVTVDLVDPTIVDIAPEDSTIINIGDVVTGAIAVELSDDDAGFGTSALRVSATRTFLDGTTTTTACVIGDEATTATVTAAFGSDVAGYRASGGTATDTDNVCEPVSLGAGAVQIPDAAGYYTFQIAARDQALNTSATEEIFILVDQTGVVIDEIDFSASLDGGDTETLSARFTDNLDLYHYDINVDYDGLLLPVTMLMPLDASFGAPLTRRVSVDDEVFFISNIREDSDDTDGFTAGFTGEADAVVFRAEDQARNLTTTSQATVQAFAIGTDVVTGFDVDIVGSDDELCVEASCDDAPQSITARLRVSEALASDGEFDRAHFYLQVVTGGSDPIYLAVSDETASTSVSTTERTSSFTGTISGAYVRARLQELVERGEITQDMLDDDPDLIVVNVIGLVADEDGNAIYEVSTELTLAGS